MTYRYYIGISLPRQLSEQIISIQEQLFDATIAKQPLEPHITLLPPPAVQTIPPDVLAEQAHDHAAHHMPLRITLRGVETYKRKAVAIEVQSPGLSKLHESLKLLVPAHTLRYYPQAHFHPHVTLDQALPGKTLPQQLIDDYRRHLDHMLPTAFETTQLTLYRWQAPRTYTAEPLWD